MADPVLVHNYRSPSALRQSWHEGLDISDPSFLDRGLKGDATKNDLVRLEKLNIVENGETSTYEGRGTEGMLAKSPRRGSISLQTESAYNEVMGFWQAKNLKNFYETKFHQGLFYHASNKLYQYLFKTHGIKLNDKRHEVTLSEGTDKGSVDIRLKMTFAELQNPPTLKKLKAETLLRNDKTGLITIDATYSVLANDELKLKSYHEVVHDNRFLDYAPELKRSLFSKMGQFIIERPMTATLYFIGGAALAATLTFGVPLLLAGIAALAASTGFMAVATAAVSFVMNNIFMAMGVVAATSLASFTIGSAYGASEAHSTQSYEAMQTQTAQNPSTSMAILSKLGNAPTNEDQTAAQQARIEQVHSDFKQFNQMMIQSAPVIPGMPSTVKADGDHQPDNEGDLGRPTTPSSPVVSIGPR